MAYLQGKAGTEPPKYKGKKKDTDLVKQVTKQVKASFESSMRLREQMREDIAFNVGGPGQWDAADYKRLTVEEKRPAMSFNLIHPLTNLICGIEEDRHQDRRYLPKGSEDEFVGRIATIAVKNLEDQGARFEETKQFRLGGVTGLGVIKVYHTYEFTDDLIEGEVRACTLETNTWYCDPRARLYNRIDARYQGELMWMDSDEIEETWPGHKPRMQGIPDWLPYEPSLTGVPDHFMREMYDKEKDLIRVMRHYYRVPVKVTLLINRSLPPDQAVQRVKDEKTAEAMIRQVYDSAGAQAAAPFQIYQTSQAHVVVNQQTGQMQSVMTPEEGGQMIDTVRQEAGTRAAGMYEVLSRDTTAIRCAHLTGWELLDDTPQEDFDGWRFCYSPFICFQDSDNVDDIKGWVRDIKDPQRVHNWSVSTIQDQLLRAPKGQTWFNKADNQDMNKLKKEMAKPGFAGEYNTQPPTYYPPGSFSPGELAMVEFSLDAGQRIPGMNAAVMGQSTQKTISGRAKVADQSAGIAGLSHIFAQWARTKEYTGLLMVKAIQQHYSPEKLDRIIGEEGRMSEMMGIPFKLTAADQYAAFKSLKDIDLDVKVGFQEASQTAREAIFTRLMQLASMGYPVPPELMLKAADTPYAKEIELAVKEKGMQPPNEAAAAALGASQGQGASAGINKT